MVLLKKHLFTELSLEYEEDDVMIAKIPVLDTGTREILSELILLLSQDARTYRKVLQHVADLFPYNCKLIYFN